LKRKKELNEKKRKKSKRELDEDAIFIFYEPGQWTPDNTTGQKIFSKNFLYQFRDLFVEEIPNQIPKELKDSTKRYYQKQSRKTNQNNMLSPKMKKNN